MTTTKTKTAKRKFPMPDIKDLLEAGAHFGHETKRWNPKFGPYIYTKREGFHVIDLQKTLEKLEKALSFLYDTASKGEILIVGTKRQAREIVKEEAVRCGAHFVVNRWVGGQISNFDTVSKGIKRLQELEEILKGDISEYNQQELSVLRREWGRLDRLYQGVKTMTKPPVAVVIIDAFYEKAALREAKGMNIPIVALVDSNTDPNGIDYAIPGNDDAIKSVELFVTYIADTILAANKGRGVKYEYTDLSRIGIHEAEPEKKPEVVEEKIIKKPEPSKEKAPKKEKVEANKEEKTKTKTSKKVSKRKTKKAKSPKKKTANKTTAKKAKKKTTKKTAKKAKKTKK